MLSTVLVIKESEAIRGRGTDKGDMQVNGLVEYELNNSFKKPRFLQTFLMVVKNI